MNRLHGFFENTEPDILSNRNDLCRNNLQGLGPADMVLLEKSDGTETFFHISGTNLSSPDSILDFFHSLESKRPKKAFRNYSYTFNRINYFTWNSFKKEDVRICYSNGNIENDIPDLRQLSLSTILRFWAPEDALYRSLNHITIRDTPALHLITPQLLSYDDLTYIASNLQCSDDLAYSLATYLTYNHDPNAAMSMIHEYHVKIPRLFIYLTALWPSFDIGDYAFEMFYSNPDDPLISSYVANYCVSKCDMTRLPHIIPALFAAATISPYPCYSLARLCLHTTHFREALEWLNFATLLKTFNPAPVDIPLYHLTEIEREFVTERADQSVLDFLQVCHEYIAIRTYEISRHDVIKLHRAEEPPSETHPSPTNPPPPSDEFALLFDPGVAQTDYLPPFHYDLSPQFVHLFQTALHEYNLKNARRISSGDAPNVFLKAFDMKDSDLLDKSFTVLVRAKLDTYFHHLVKAKMDLLTGKKPTIQPPSKVSCHEAVVTQLLNLLSTSN